MPMSTRNTEGKYKQQYSDEELVEAVERLQERGETQGTGTSDVAEEIDGHPNHVRRRLKEIEKDGKIRVAKGGRALVWLPKGGA
jgi:Mn-dependent DtxR family transcriptional regulator